MNGHVLIVTVVGTLLCLTDECLGRIPNLLITYFGNGTLADCVSLLVQLQTWWAIKGEMDVDLDSLLRLTTSQNR